MPLSRRGVYWFAHVGRSVLCPSFSKPKLVITWVMPGPMVLKLDLEVGPDQEMTPIDAEVIGSKVKVTVTLNGKSLSKWLLDNACIHGLQTWHGGMSDPSWCLLYYWCVVKWQSSWHFGPCIWYSIVQIFLTTWCSGGIMFDKHLLFSECHTHLGSGSDAWSEFKVYGYSIAVALSMSRLNKNCSLN